LYILLFAVHIFFWEQDKKKFLSFLQFSGCSFFFAILLDVWERAMEGDTEIETGSVSRPSPLVAFFSFLCTCRYQCALLAHTTSILFQPYSTCSTSDIDKDKQEKEG